MVELHPQAVQRFKENLEALVDILVVKDALPDLELIGTFRSLVESLIVSPRKAGEEYEVSFRGYLASLMGAEMSALSMVAGDRYGLKPRHSQLVFPIDCVGKLNKRASTIATRRAANHRRSSMGATDRRSPGDNCRPGWPAGTRNTLNSGQHWVGL